MATLRVYYFGLIGHISTSEPRKKNYAALVRNEHHIPLIILNSSARLIKPEVQKITFGEMIPADIDQLFDSYVPPLKKIFGGKLTANIKEEMIEVRYPGAGSFGSMLSVVQLYGKRGLYSGLEPHLTCVARVTVATLTTTAQHILCRATDKYDAELWSDNLSLDSDKCVVVANVSDNIANQVRRFAAPLLRHEVSELDSRSHEAHGDAEHDHGSAPQGGAHATIHVGPHVQIFGELLDDDVAVTVVEHDDCAASKSLSFVGCDWVKKLFEPYEWYSGDTVECGNTQWP